MLIPQDTSKFLLKCTLCIFVIGLVECENCINCLYGEEYCDPGTKVCTFGCKPGWRNDRCDQRCIVDDCRECTVSPSTIEECTRCNAGFYGPLCNLPCGDKCNGVKGFDTCDHSGNCLFGCKPPYSGAKCQEQDCPFDNCKRCDSLRGNTYCWQCESGYHWDSYRDQCIRCSENCKNGPQDCDSFTGTCRECKSGWFGPKCLYQCNIANCTTCAHKKDNVICKSCNVGMYPGPDGFTCKSCEDRHCLGECSRNSGECFNGCQQGWFGEGYLCDRQCTISNCEICSVSYHRNIVCSKCKKDYYVENKMCARCPATCRNSCDDHSSDCVGGCLDGYYGDQCEMKCNPHCLNNKCISSTGYCDCEEGWFGYRCDRDCPIHCLDCPNFKDGICASCEPGRFGPTCEIRCSRNCRPRSYGGYVYCDKDTGACELGCINGVYGDTCNRSCNSNCESNVCDRVTGNCLSGCTQNYYGPMCQYPCPENCRHVLQGYKRTCDAIRGECLDGCINGKYGTFCNLTCSDRCKEDMCDQSSGDCLLGCKIGYAGEDCDIICANNCPNDCSPNCKDVVCDKVTKSCISGCNTGWYGTTCMNICSDKCVGRICEQINGHCVGKCIDGFYGPSCNLHCSDNCFDAECDKTTGFCLKGCKPPYHGDKCDESCPSLCMNGTCNQVTGRCFSCGIGKHGDLCDESCQPGTYGENCELICGHCRDNVPCNIYTGDCLPGSGCEIGYTGEKCMKALYSKEESVENTVNMDLVIGCSVAAVVCIVIFAIVVFFWLKSRKLNTKKKSDEPVVVYRDANVSIERAGLSGDRQSNQSTHSNMMLLGDTSSRLEINLQQEITQTDIYTLYKGQINTGARKQYCCVKLVKLKDIEEDKTSLSKLMKESELQTLCSSHVNVLHLITSYQNTDVYCVALDNSIENGLTQYLHNLQSDDKSLEPDNICRLLQFAIDICSALCHIQSMKIIHRMVQLRHIYLSDTLVAKLGDFYWANYITDTEQMIELPEDSYPWWSPEVFIRQHFSYQSDIWSFGVTLWEIFSLGKHPFQDVDREEYKQMILDGIRPSKPQIVHLTKYRVMKSCWRYTPEDRPTAEQILQQLIDIQNRFSDVERVVVHV